MDTTINLPRSPDSASLVPAPSIPPAFVYALLGLLFVLYSVQIFGPLRLVQDSITYLTAASSLVDSGSWFTSDEPMVLPPGYPIVLALLERAGLGSSHAIIGLNVLLLLGGLAAYSALLRNVLSFDRRSAATVGVLTLLSYVTVKYSAVVLSECLFLAAVALSLLALSRLEDASPGTRWPYVVVGSLLVAGTTSIRMFGVALVPALMFAIVMPRTADRDRRPRYRELVAAAILTLAWGALVAVVSVLAFPEFNYVATLAEAYTHVSLDTSMIYSAATFGDIVLNVPFSRLPWDHEWILAIVGAPVLLVVSHTLIWLRRRCLRTTDVFLINYFSILFVWPWSDVRYLLPVLPLIVAYVMRWVRDHDLSRYRLALAGYVFWLTITGMAALGYSIRMSLSGPAFPELYTELPRWRASYRSAYDQGGVDRGDVRMDVLRVLERYDPRAARGDALGWSHRADSNR